MSLPTEGFNESLRTWIDKSTPPVADGLQKVVIDAGHGGKDPGGMGDNSMEKHIALSIARLLAIGIRTNYPNVEVIMTRSDDTFIPLYERAEIANKAGADLFISIHANIMPGSKATFGTETFVMGQHVAEQNLRVAKRENASILLESGDVTANYGYDPNSPEGHILMSMQQHAFLERSILFAEAVERQFAGAGRKSRGVKQAGFVVLKATTMPAVLVETGFMSNTEEESFLLSKPGQQKLATALLLAFGEYYETITDQSAPVAMACPAPTNHPGGPLLPQPIPSEPSPQVQPAVVPSSSNVNIFSKEIDLDKTAPRQWTAKGVDPSPISYQLSPVSYSPPAPAPQTVNPVTFQPSSYGARPTVIRKEIAPSTTGINNRVIPGAASVSTEATVYDYPSVDVDSTSPSGYRFKEARQRKNPLPSGQIDLRTIPDSELLYAVQVFATERDLDLSQAPFNAVPYPIVKVREGKLYKYQVRNLPNAAAAKSAKQRIKASGIRDSLVVVYLNGKRLPPRAVNYLLAR